MSAKKAAKKSSGASLRRLMDAAQGPLYVVDVRRRIAYCNPAFTAWTGLTLDDLADQRCDYHSAEAKNLLAQMAAALCPPPTAFAGEECASRVLIENAAGEIVEREARFTPLSLNSEQPAGVLAVLGEEDLEQPTEDATSAATPADSQSLHVQVARMRKDIREAYRMDRLLGATPAMERVRRQIELAIDNAPNVLVAGPPGSGREHVARTIYYGGPQESAGMLVPLSCEILDAELLEATITALLGSQELDDAHHPALLLLDVDRLSSSCQDLLAQLLLANEMSLRTIASSRGNLESLAESGVFRSDLAFALSTLVIELPPLSQRLADIPLLAQAVVEESNLLGGSQREGFTPEAMERLLQHPFVENVDELRRIALQACANARGPLVGVNDLPPSIQAAYERDAHPHREFETIQLDAFLQEIEAELIRRAMTATQGNRAQAAELLGISRSKLIRRLAESDSQTPPESP